MPANSAQSGRGAPSSQPIRFAGGILDEHRHVCAFFDRPEDEHRGMQPFIREGLEAGEKAFHIVDPSLREDYIRRLETGGIDVRGSMARGQFELKNWEEAYLRESHFDQDAMLALIEDVLRKSRADGFPQTRLVAHMEWSLQDFPGVGDLVEYEARLNYVLPRYKDATI